MSIQTMSNDPIQYLADLHSRTNGEHKTDDVSYAHLISNMRREIMMIITGKQTTSTVYKKFVAAAYNMSQHNSGRIMCLRDGWNKEYNSSQEDDVAPVASSIFGCNLQVEPLTTVMSNRLDSNARDVFTRLQFIYSRELGGILSHYESLVQLAYE